MHTRTHSWQLCGVLEEVMRIAKERIEICKEASGLPEAVIGSFEGKRRKLYPI